jgi:hypothetical protein
MARYVYACSNPEHQWWNVQHGMTSNTKVICPQCHEYMHRVPQAFRFYQNPQNLLLDKMTERFADYQKEKRYGIKRKYARGEPF